MCQRLEPRNRPTLVQMSACPSCGRENRDDARFCDSCGAALAEAPPPREQRKTVTVLFCDVTGSTELGREARSGDVAGAARPLLRAHEGDRRAPRRHGREVHRRRGDGRVRRAGRARGRRAARGAGCGRDARGASPSSASRAGSASPPARSSPAPRSGLRPATRSTSPRGWSRRRSPGEILIGEETLRLVRDAVEVEAVEPLAAEGQGGAGATPTGCSPSVRERRLPRSPRRADGRPRARAAAARGRVRAGRLRARLPAVHDPGCRPASASPGSRPSSWPPLEDAVVVRGRCLPYGEGITYWPVVEIVEAAARGGARPGRGRDDRRARSATSSSSPRARRSPGRFASCSRRSRPSGRSSASSTTCTGARRPSSTWSSTSPTSPATRRSCCSAWRGRTCSTAARAGAAAR